MVVSSLSRINFAALLPASQAKAAVSQPIKFSAAHDVFFASTVHFGWINPPIDYSVKGEKTKTTFEWHQGDDPLKQNLLDGNKVIGSVSFKKAATQNVKVTPINSNGGGIALKLEPKDTNYSVTVAPGGTFNAFGVTANLVKEGPLPKVTFLDKALATYKKLQAQKLPGIIRPDVPGVNPAEHKIIILAAGSGSRLREVSGDTPKNLFPLANGKSVIENLVEGLVNDGFEESNMVIVVQKAHRAGFEEALKKYPNINFFEQQDGPNGTAGATHDVVESEQYKHWFAKDSVSDTKPVLLLGADHIHNIDLRVLLAKHMQSQSAIGLGGYPSTKEAILGKLGVWNMQGAVNQSGPIKSFIEKPETEDLLGENRVGNIFLHTINPSVLRELKTIKKSPEVLQSKFWINKKEFDFSTHVVSPALEKDDKVFGEVYNEENGYWWSDIGTRKALYEDTLRLILSGKVYRPEDTRVAHELVDKKGVFYQTPELRQQLEGKLAGPVWVLNKPTPTVTPA